jgi:predicted lactoylglutathione lyase
MNPRISMITLGVNDLHVSVRFYRDGLDFPQMESPPEVAFFTLNGTWLGLYNREALAKDATVKSDGTGFNSFTLSHNVKSEVEVNTIVKQAIDAGASLVKEPQKVAWGGYSGYFKDPDGHLWEVAHNPFSGSDLVIKTHNSLNGHLALPSKPKPSASPACNLNAPA